MLYIFCVHILILSTWVGRLAYTVSNILYTIYGKWQYWVIANGIKINFIHLWCERTSNARDHLWAYSKTFIMEHLLSRDQSSIIKSHDDNCANVILWGRPSDAVQRSEKANGPWWKIFFARTNSFQMEINPVFVLVSAGTTDNPQTLL